ncbi:thiosulfate oxidation carrier complex protein SoxZ [Rhizobacter sp. J219]|uniref:thiosulfate oxidation carrier complex protein SoxZ n=1 Tax=Rhizobacter sp. J219 TaxID=2898430 RepID=UPI0021509E4B|nr:thiosulfate oxidation carrier complex protein SoxZ [Rhizobacter sp. J219]MCR5884926.1 thiosulfate oxidation carrier complex protein SoxZ [Rhizobacter sp. J219]
MARTLITVPTAARKGEVIELRALIAHVMETGFRPDANGSTKPRDLITHFSCRYNGELVFSAELYPAVAANPYIAFTTVATESGTLTFEWTGDNGFQQSESVKITVA